MEKELQLPTSSTLDLLSFEPVRVPVTEASQMNNGGNTRGE